MKRALLMAVLAAVCGATCAEEDTNLYYKAFYYRTANTEHKEVAATLQKYLSDESGVTWPAGSDVISSLSDSSQLIVRNTQTNLALIEQMFYCQHEVNQIEIEFSVVAFRREDLEKLQIGEGISLDSLSNLRCQGHSRLVTTARVVTKSGQEAIVKEVQEVIYPTEMDCGFGTNQVGISSWAVTPCKFEMREVGTLLQVVPELLGSGQRINLMLSPQWVVLKKWETFEAGAGSRDESQEIPFRQPVFAVSTIQTQVTVVDGETILLGGGKKQDDDWIQYHFVKAWSVIPKKPK